MSTLELENIKHPDNSGNNIALASDGSMVIDGAARVDNSAATPVRVHINNSGTNDYGSIYADTAAAYKNLIINPNGGNIGIGTTSPNATLTVSQSSNNIFAVERTGIVSGSGQFGINVENNSQATVSYDDGAQLVFGTASSPSTHTGFTERMRIDSSGRVTTPNQPVFRATNGSSVTGSNSVIIFTQKDFDVSNSYNTGNGAFTAPATGHYLFYVAGLYNVTNTSPTWKVSFYKNNSQDSVLAEYQSSLNSNGYNVLFNGSIITHMAAGDYMQIYNHSSNVHISGTQTKFGGYLIG